MLKAFIVGGLICVLGQLLIDKTSLGTAKILVTFVTLGCVLSWLGLYEKLVDFAGAGATVPLPGFGHMLFQGVKEEIDKVGFVGIFTGGFKAAAGGIGFALFSSFVMAVIFNPKVKK